jgi:predicted transcriptional regulator
MADITITGKIAERLQQLAQDTKRSIEEILEEALDSYLRNEEDMLAGPVGSLARMAWVARQHPIEVEPTDIAERSRDILRDEYAAHLLKRRQAADD